MTIPNPFAGWGALYENLPERFYLPGELAVARNTMVSIAWGILPDPVTILDDGATNQRQDLHRKVRYYFGHKGFVLVLMLWDPINNLATYRLRDAQGELLVEGSLPEVCLWVTNMEHMGKPTLDEPTS